MSNTFYHGRYSVSTVQWEFIEPPSKFGGRPALNPRTVFNAILWIFDSEVFEKILQALIDDCREYYLVEIDSIFCKIHQHAADARKIFGN